MDSLEANNGAAYNAVVPVMFGGAAWAKALQAAKRHPSTRGFGVAALTTVGLGYLYSGYQSYADARNHNKNMGHSYGAIAAGAMTLLAFMAPFNNIPKMARSISSIGAASCVYFLYRSVSASKEQE